MEDSLSFFISASKTTASITRQSIKDFPTQQQQTLSSKTHTPAR
jgi:hypothetical protein